MFRKTQYLNIGCLVFCGLIGALAGAWIGKAVVIAQERREAAVLASRHIQRLDALSDEAVRALGLIERSRNVVCSNDDIAHMRSVVLASIYIKSAARVVNGKVICSATLGRLDVPQVVSVPDFVTHGGRRVYMNAEMQGVPGTTALVLQQESASVMLPMAAYTAIADPRLDYNLVVDYGQGRMVFMAQGERLPVEQLDIQPDVPLIANGKQYEVRCSIGYSNCLLARMRDEPVLSESPVFMGFTLLGLVAGLGAGWGLSAALARARSLGSKLRRAMRAGALSVVYQPIVRLADRRRVGAEALVRWRGRDGAYISPDLFISVAEQEGFICDVTRYVLRQVVDELSADLRRHPGFQVTINVSAADVLDPSFAGFVHQTLQQARVAPRNIGFEITERSTAARASVAAGIQKLRNAGHSVYIDDFGTDYSSLSYLADLKVDAIKLDRMFTRGLDEGYTTTNLAPQIVAMIEALELGLVIEGIEQEGQAAYFRRLAPGAMGQGWLFGRPLPAADILPTAGTR